MDIHEMMHDGSLYRCADKDLVAEQVGYQEAVYDYNATRPSEGERRERILRGMFAEIGEGCWVEPPLHASWGCRFVHFGSNVYANFNLTLVDDTHIYVGDDTMFGPNVTLVTAGHPLEPELRGSDPHQFNKPIRIGSNCWLGEGVTVLPGVTIGDNSVIGAGSLVTKDIPAGVLAYGIPCRVIRELPDEGASKIDE